MYLESIKEITERCKYYEDLYEIIWRIGENKKIKRENYNGVKIGLFNTPCAGFGDIIVCNTFYDYLNKWYPGASITICTTTPSKYADLGIKGNIYKLYNKENNEDSECIEYLPAKNTVTSKDENWNTEWLSLNVSIKCVNSLEEAMEHMGTHIYIYIINIHT